MANAVFFSNTAQQTTLSGSISAGATTVTVGATTGFPPSFPYVLALDFGAATEELVSVTAAAGTNLTVTRGYGGTSAQSHSLGAVVRHVYDATEATAFRTHEAATAAIHGVAGTLVGTSDTQTLANKTLTSPTVNGGALSGTFTGAPTFTGGPTFSTSSPLFVRTSTTDLALRVTVGGDSNSRLAAQADGTLLWSAGSGSADTNLYRSAANTLKTDDALVVTGELQPNNLVRSTRTAATDSAYESRASGDANARWFVRSDGLMSWGPGSGAVDTVLYRSAADTLRTDDSLVVSGSLTVSGVGQKLFVRRTTDLPRATATLADDPELTVSVSANSVYRVWGMLHFETTDATNADLNLDWTVPSGASGTWTGFGQPTGATATDGDVRTVSTAIDAARNYGAINGNNLTVIVSALLITTNAGTYAVSWARTGASGTLTLKADSHLLLERVA